MGTAKPFPRGAFEVSHIHSGSSYAINLDQYMAIAAQAGMTDEQVDEGLLELTKKQGVSYNGYEFSANTHIIAEELMFSFYHSDREIREKIVAQYKLAESQMLIGMQIIIPFHYGSQINLEAFYNGLSSQVTGLPTTAKEAAQKLLSEFGIENRILEGKLGEVDVFIHLYEAEIEVDSDPDHNLIGCHFTRDDTIIKIGHTYKREEWTIQPCMHIHLRFPQFISCKFHPGLAMMDHIISLLVEAMYSNKSA